MVVDAYVERLGVDLHGDAQIFRNRSGDRYLKNSMAADFRVVRNAKFGPHERRQMLDFRRSGAVEAIVGDAEPAHRSHAMGNSLSASNALFKTYVPVQEATIVRVSDARRKGHQRLRTRTKGDEKSEQPALKVGTGGEETTPSD